MKTLSLIANHRPLSRHDRRERRLFCGVASTDYGFRPTTDDRTVASQPAGPAAKPDLRAFRKLSQELLTGEDRSNYALEMIVLGFVIAIVAWPLISLLVVLAQTAGG